MSVSAISRSALPCVVVVGDVMVDHYLWGSCERISPEAPVQVVNVLRETFTLGGAANVVANLAALGARPAMVGVVGDDAGRAQIAEGLVARGVSPDGLVVAQDRPTTAKRRVIAGSQQIVRVDHETAAALSPALEDALIARALRRLDEASVCILSDYGKGVLSERVTRTLIAACRARALPVLVDPKGRDYAKYRGATMITPNRKEAAAATGLTLDGDARIREAGRLLRETHALHACLITLSEDGMALFEADRETLLPTEAREVFDVTGAGDTVIAALAVCLARGQSLVEACRFANAAAGVAIGKVGSATVTMQEVEWARSGRESVTGKILSAPQLTERVAHLREQGRRIVFTNGCFDLLHAGHVRYLAQAARLGDVLVVGLNDDASVRRLKGAQRPVNPLEDRALVLASLAPVSFVSSFGEDTPLELIRAVQPDVLVKGGDYQPDDIVGADLVRARGGSVQVLPFLQGRSTTRMIARMAGAAE